MTDQTPTTDTPARRSRPPKPPSGGSDPAFDRIYAEVVEVVRTVALNGLLIEDAEEIIQDVGIKFWKAWEAGTPDLSNAERRRRWVVAVARNAVLDSTRRDDARERREIDAESAGPVYHLWMDPVGELTASELEAVVVASLKALPELTLDSVMRVREGGGTYGTVARERSVSANTIKKQVLAGVSAIRAAVNAYQEKSR